MRKTYSFLGSKPDFWAMIILVLTFSIVLSVFISNSLKTLNHPYPLDYGEAPLLDQALRLSAGKNIYRLDLSTPPYTISNYPPLFVLILIPLVKLFGPVFWIGRMISIVGALAAALFIALTLFSFTRDVYASTVTGMLFLAIPYVVHWSGLLRIDLIALAFSTGAMYLLTRWSSTRWSTAAAALALVAAIFTRQSYALAAPFAAFVWLWARDRRQALQLAAMVTGLSLSLFITINWITKGGFYFNIITANINEFSFERLEWHLRQLGLMAPILLIIGAVFLLLLPGRMPSWLLLSPYLLAAFGSSLTIGKIGSNVNYFLEFSAALSLVTGAALAWSRQHKWLRVALSLLITIQCGYLARTTLEDYIEPLEERIVYQDEIHQLEDIVIAEQGSILADEYMGLLTLQGQPLYIQPFEVTQLARAGLWDQTPFIEAIRDREFPLVLIHHFPDFAVYQERWTTEMLSAIDQNYTLVQILADTHVYKPRGWQLQLAGESQTCPEAIWQLPTDGARGLYWNGTALDFFGWGTENSVPVYAVADGLLTRNKTLGSGIVIQHDDPLRPGEYVWSVYAHMKSASGVEEYIVEEFPPGLDQVPILAGQLLGYQGVWSGRMYWPISTHLRFALVSVLQDASISSDIPIENSIDPSRYLGIKLKDQEHSDQLIILNCRE